jgi:hypothetical protein
MTTQTTEEAAVTTAVEAEEVTDHTLIAAFITANSASVTTLQTNANALATSLSSLQNQQVAQGFANQFAALVTAYQTFAAQVLAYETSPPPV